MIAGFWRRLFAFLIDCLLLGLVGQAIGLAAMDQLSALGGWGRVVGFGIALIYFGLMDSRLFKGQTLGGRIAKVKVVTVTGEALGIGASLIRAGIFALPFFLNNAPVTPEQASLWLTLTIAIVVFGLGLSIVYMCLFNRGTRQCPHDLVVGAYTIRSDNGAQVSKHKIWRGHFVIIAVIFIAAGSVALYVPTLTKKEPFLALLSVQRVLQQTPGVRFATVDQGTTTFSTFGTNPKSIRALNARLIVSRKDINKEVLADAAAKVILDVDPASAQQDRIILQVSYGYDIGIASWWHTDTFSRSPGAWRQRLDLQTEGSGDAVPSITGQ